MYLDVDVFVALIKKSDRLAPFAEEVRQNAHEEHVTSAASVIELEYVLTRLFNAEVSVGALEFIRRDFPQLRFIPLDESIVTKSVSLRIEQGLGIFDSIHAATALAARLPIASSDDVFDRVLGLTRIMPKDV